MPDEEDYSNFSLMDLFRIEVENHSSILESGLVLVEGNDDPKQIEPLMRAAHSIKGAARVVGLDGAVKLAHAMEDILSSAQKGNLSLNSDDIDSLLKGSDFFKELATSPADSIPEILEAKTSEIDSLVGIYSTIFSGGSKKLQKKEEINQPEHLSTEGSTGDSKILPDILEEMKDSAEKTPPVEAQVKESVVKPQETDKVESAFIRIQSENLSRLMGLAGETYIQSKYSRTFSEGLLELKSRQGRITNELEQLYYSMQDGISSELAASIIANSIRKLNDTNTDLSKLSDNFRDFSGRLENITTRLYDESIKSRMRPFSEGTQGFRRMVRDISKSLSKQVNIIIKGGSINVDRDILEKLESPLNHIIRNAVDHGIEPPEARIAAGKSPEGTITVEARHSSGMLLISAGDDGKGIDPEKIRVKIIEKGYVAAEIAENLTNAELLEFLFLPGFSTADKLTEISGRGVGLDIVFSMVQEVGGTVRIESQKGIGTTFILLLPITLSVINTLVVEIAGDLYAIPLTRIDRIVKAAPEEIKIIENKQYCSIGNENIGIIPAEQVLGVESRTAASSYFHIIIISDRLNRYGIVTDKFIGKYELSVKPFEKRLGKIPNVSAGAIMEDGSPVIILDVDDLVRSIDNILSEGSLAKLIMKDLAAKRQKRRILVVDDSITVREVERKILENKGYEVALSVDGMDAWNILHSHKFDLVVTDVDMPRMNGIELVSRIKSELALKDMPVMIVSYKDRDEDKLRGLEAGANYYLTKSSFHDESLVNAVVDLIGKA